MKGTSPRVWNETLLRNLVKTLDSLHGKPPLPDAPVFDPFLYDDQKKLPSAQDAIYRKLVDVHFRKTNFCLCHNDVHSANLVLDEAGVLNLIDYEWSCLNNPLWELGNFIREERLSVVQIGVLLNEYGKKVKQQELYEFIFLAACYG